MKALIQRVSESRVEVGGVVVGEIGRGILVLLGVEKADDAAAAERLVEKLLAYRIFPDDAGKMNLSVRDIAGSVLVVSQFTLAADTKKGLRPSFSSAAPPAQAEQLYEMVIQKIADKSVQVACGRFAADMQVRLVNDGPVTFMLEG